MDYPASAHSRVVTTNDGSHTLYSAHFNQHYHSLQGSLQESKHIFIDLGLKPAVLGNKDGGSGEGARPVCVFEMGFGTGLNALLAWQLADSLRHTISYTGIEAYPVPAEEAEKLNFGQVSGAPGFLRMHQAEWASENRLSDWFTFRKEQAKLHDFHTLQKFDVVFFDAFSPEAQPELWTAEVFGKIGRMMEEGGFLVTYSSKGEVRRALASVGFRVEKHPGPGRKREVIRAVWGG